MVNPLKGSRTQLECAQRFVKGEILNPKMFFPGNYMDPKFEVTSTVRFYLLAAYYNYVQKLIDESGASKNPDYVIAFVQKLIDESGASKAPKFDTSAYVTRAAKALLASDWKSFAQACDYGFTWSTSPQGSSFWEKACSHEGYQGKKPNQQALDLITEAVLLHIGSTSK